MSIKKIDIRNLKVGMVTADPVYSKHSGKKILMMRMGTLIKNELQIRRLMDAGVTSVEIDTDIGIDTVLALSDLKKWEDLIKEKEDRKTMDQILARHTNTFINSLTNIIMKTYTSRMLINEEPVASIIKDIILFAENNTDVLLAMIRLKSVDEYTYSHSINTTVLCITLARALGFKYTDIVRFAKGTFLADLGMTSYPSRMIKRPSGLSKKEIEELKKHPIYTIKFLKDVGIDDPFIEMLIIQHHERYDGSGYPYRLKGDEIHPISKLFAIADVYDAMTSRRPHRPGIPPHMVLGEIHKMSGTLFDPKMKDFFIKQIGVFPVGNVVRLTGGNVAIVAAQNRSDPLRPQVIVFQKKKKYTRPGEREVSGYTISRGAWELVDLAEGSEKYGKIQCGLDHRKLHINPDTYLLQI